MQQVQLGRLGWLGWLGRPLRVVRRRWVLLFSPCWAGCPWLRGQARVL